MLKYNVRLLRMPGHYNESANCIKILCEVRSAQCCNESCCSDSNMFSETKSGRAAPTLIFKKTGSDNNAIETAYRTVHKISQG